jgi:hypothetical protein
MSLIGRVTTFFRRLVHRLFGTRLAGPYIPVQIGKELSAVMQRQRKVSVSRIYVPNRYVVQLHPADYAQIAPLQQTLAQELCQHLVGIAQREGLHFLTSPQVSFQQGNQLKPGCMEIQAFFDDVGVQTGVTKGLPPLEDTLTEEGEVEQATRIFGERTRMYLVCLSGPEQNMRFYLPEEGEFTIGREQDNDLVLVDPCVSRRHAVVVVREGEVFLRDLSSKNGTYVDDLRIEETQLADGNRILCGNTLFKFVAGE